MGTVVSLVEPVVSTESLLAADYLRQEILACRIDGFMWVAFHPGQRYSIDWAGEAMTNPTFSLGAAGHLYNEVAKLEGPK